MDKPLRRNTVLSALVRCASPPLSSAALTGCEAAGEPFVPRLRYLSCSDVEHLWPIRSASKDR